VAGRDYLKETPEAEATGPVAELYADIRAVIGLPLVNLIYRHLAATGRLEGAWSALRPNVTHPALAEGAAELAAIAGTDAVARLSLAALRAVGVEDELPGARATLEAYNHANSRNLIALTALLHGAEGTTRPTTAAALDVAGPPDGAMLLPMASLDALPEPTGALLDEMAVAFASPGQTVIVPGLFRHFAHEPALLALCWTVLRPAVDGGVVARRGNLVALRARALAAALPEPVNPAEDEQTRAVLARFIATIPRMLVAGVALRAALDSG
jgi:hypothetical protein